MLSRFCTPPRVLVTRIFDTGRVPIRLLGFFADDARAAMGLSALVLFDEKEGSDLSDVCRGGYIGFAKGR